MNNFSWTKAIGFGVLLWIVMLAIVSTLIGSDLYSSVWTQFAVAIAAGVLAYVFALYVTVESAGQAFGYGLMWAAIGIVLDFIGHYGLEYNPAMYSLWAYWLGYAFVFFAPWLRLEARELTHAHA